MENNLFLEFKDFREDNPTPYNKETFNELQTKIKEYIDSKMQKEDNSIKIITDGTPVAINEYYDNKLVYVQVFNLGSLPNAGVKTVSLTNLPNNIKIIDYEILTYRSSDKQTFKLNSFYVAGTSIKSDSPISANLIQNPNQCVIQAAANRENMTATLTVKFTYIEGDFNEAN